jgi:hypothetical protein
VLAPTPSLGRVTRNCAATIEDVEHWSPPLHALGMYLASSPNPRIVPLGAGPVKCSYCSIVSGRLLRAKTARSQSITSFPECFMTALL